MSDFTRTRGDDYPFTFEITVNDAIVDISSDTLKFSYKNDTEVLKTIDGTLLTDGTDGKIKFVPNSGVDFTISGVFEYDVQRVSNGYTYTHAKGNLILDEDVTP